ncbi:putative sulfate transporter [Podosphaera aphanis]|nr:putative sulfate transporter [Podosphaera aphanis]
MTIPTSYPTSTGHSTFPALSHVPATPSGLRESHIAPTSSESTPNLSDTSVESSPPQKDIPTTPKLLRLDKGKKPERDVVAGKPATENTALLAGPSPYDVTTASSAGPSSHGTFNLRYEDRACSIKSNHSDPVSYSFSFRRQDSRIGLKERIRNLLQNIGVATNSFGHGRKKSTTSLLVERHGISNTKSMYLSYYIPFFAWIQQYRWNYIKGDLVAASTMASFYLPMALSIASNVAHVPPINGLYSFVFNPLIYAIFGSSPLMILGPEAPGSLLIGSLVKSMIDDGDIPDDDLEAHAQVAGVITGIAGAIILIAGLTRLGFLDSVLSKPFLRGFVSAVGFVIAVDQLIPELGLVDVADSLGNIGHGSSIEKLQFIVRYAHQASGITCIVAGTSFLIIMIFRELKKRLQPRYPLVAYFPDRFIVVVLSAILTWKLQLDLMGLEILGEVKSRSKSTFPFQWPLKLKHLDLARDTMGTCFLIALLGFFESSVAAKSLASSDTDNAIQGIALSPNRELVALGLANFIGACFCSLPAFGGYGRSKVNVSTGGKTPMSSVFLSIITAISVLYLLPLFYYVPKAVLSSMITVVAWSLIEEAPHDIMFFIRIRGFSELGLMAIIFAATIFYSLTFGIAIGIGLSVLSVIRHSTRPRIQILGRVPGRDQFANAEDNFEELESIDGCLVVKIPEPLTFANTGELKNRLRRLELYGSTQAHPALPRVRPAENNKNIIFDIHGVTGIDGSGTQVLQEIVHEYRKRDVQIFFSRCPSESILQLFRRSGIIDICGGMKYFVSDVDVALRLIATERENPAVDSGDEGQASNKTTP